MANIKRVEKPVKLSLYLDKAVIDELREKDPYFNVSALCQNALERKLKELKQKEREVMIIRG